MDLIKGLEKELGIVNLSDNERETILRDLANKIQTQFLHDVYTIIGENKCKALEASLKMGEEFYETTLKHLVPDYETIFAQSKKTILDEYRGSH